MSDPKLSFDAAVAQSNNLAVRPDNVTLLKIYGYFKQATLGDNVQDKPGYSDLVARAKWDAWTQCKGMSQAEAQASYVELIESLSN